MALSSRSRHEVQVSLAAEVLRASGEVRLAALGSSMVPAILPGDVLTIRQTRATEVRRGDVVLCARSDRFVVHRVVREVRAQGDTRWIMRGDALSDDDPPVAESDLIGRVVAIERDGRQWAPSRRSAIERAVGWGVRHSALFLRLVLHVHAVRRRAGQDLFAATALGVKECS